jgi:hypothetical protein
MKGIKMKTEMTADEVSTVMESILGYMAWIETTLEGNPSNKEYLQAELARCKTAYFKLDEAWEAESDNPL